MRTIKRIISYILTTSLILSSTLNTFANVSNGKMMDKDTNLRDVEFFSSAGTLVINPKLAVYTNKDNTKFRSAYTYSDPRPLGSEEKVRPSSQKINNEELVKVILAFEDLYSPERIANQFNMSVDKVQIENAIQLALWQESAKTNKEFIINNNSINDLTIRNLASEILLWADKIVKQNNKKDVLDYLFSEEEPKLNTSEVQKNIENNKVIYGPYSIVSSTESTYTVYSEHIQMLSSSMEPITSITPGQRFYFDLSTTESIDNFVSLIGYSHSYTLEDKNKRLFLNKKLKENRIEFNLKTSQDIKGMLNIKVSDMFTEELLDEIEVFIKDKDERIIDSKLTDFSGNVIFNLPIGDYNIEVKTPSSYSQQNTYNTRIEFIGDIKNISIPLKPLYNKVKLIPVDSETLKLVETFEYFIYNKQGKLIKNKKVFDLNNTEIDIEQGEYYIVLEPNGNYSITNPVDLTLTTGEIKDVQIFLNPIKYQTELNLLDSKETDTYEYNIYKDSYLLLTKTGKNNIKVNLDNQNYTVSAKNTDTKVLTESKSFNPKEEDYSIFIETNPGDVTVSFNITDSEYKEPIPGIQIGLFDSQGNNVSINKTDEDGKVTFTNLNEYNIYYITVVSIHNSFSGEFDKGNKFMAYDREYDISILPADQSETNYITPYINYTHDGYELPEPEPESEPIEQLEPPIEESKPWWKFWG